MARQIFLDTETTGISHKQGHRIIEVGCLEAIDRKMTGNHFHHYINPEREIDEGAMLQAKMALGDINIKHKEHNGKIIVNKKDKKKD